jgi:hypothetical protein
VDIREIRGFRFMLLKRDGRPRALRLRTTPLPASAPLLRCPAVNSATWAAGRVAVLFDRAGAPGAVI